MKISHRNPEKNIRQKLEILFALRKLGEQLTPEELVFIEDHSTADMRQFEKVFLPLICQQLRRRYTRLNVDRGDMFFSL